MQQQAEIYKVAGVDEDEPALNPAQKRKEAMLEDVSLRHDPCYIFLDEPGAANTP